MQSLRHCSWITRTLIWLLKNRPEILELHVRVPCPITDDFSDETEPDERERQLTIGHLLHCYALESEATEERP